MTHYLESLDKDKTVYKFDKFDSDTIKQCIINYFTLDKNVEDELWLYKVSTNEKTIGDTYIDTFVYRNGNVCKEVQKGDRTFYKVIHSKMLTNGQIADHLLGDMDSYEDFVKEIIVGRLMDSSHKRIYWDAWFRGAKGKDLEKADKGVIYTN
jgi:hypothetical protein